MHIEGDLEEVFVEKPMQSLCFRLGKHKVVAVQIGTIGVASLVDFAAIWVHLWDEGNVHFFE